MTESERSELVQKILKEHSEEKKAKEEEAQRKKKEKIQNGISYLIGSSILAIVASSVIPELLNKLSGMSYKAMIKLDSKKRDSEDWGPIIEKKNKK